MNKKWSGIKDVLIINTGVVTAATWRLLRYNSQNYSQNERERERRVFESASQKLVLGQRVGCCEIGLPQKGWI